MESRGNARRRSSIGTAQLHETVIFTPSNPCLPHLSDATAHSCRDRRFSRNRFERPEPVSRTSLPHPPQYRPQRVTTHSDNLLICRMHHDLRHRGYVRRLGEPTFGKFNEFGLQPQPSLLATGTPRLFDIRSSATNEVGSLVLVAATATRQPVLAVCFVRASLRHCSTSALHFQVVRARPAQPSNHRRFEGCCLSLRPPEISLRRNVPHQHLRAGRAGRAACY